MYTLNNRIVFEQDQISKCTRFLSANEALSVNNTRVFLCTNALGQTKFEKNLMFKT